MDPREQALKAGLDGTFMKFAGSYGEGKWPFSLVQVEPHYIPNYCRKTYTEAAQEAGRRNNRALVKTRKRGGMPLRVPTEAEIKLIRQHEAEGIKQEYTKAQLGCGSDTWKRFRIAAGFAPRKWEAV
jgi:hypothetical protein